MFSLRKEALPLVLMLGLFLGSYHLPVEALQAALSLPAWLAEALHLLRWYAREHVLLCLVPAFFISGAITVFVDQGSVMRFLGPKAHRGLAYGVASVSGTVLAVCSCTVLPLFGGIYKRGAGLGPASAFLYSGPAINVLAIALTARVLGADLGFARALGAILFSLLVGGAMAWIFRREEEARAGDAAGFADEAGASVPARASVALVASLIGILIFASLPPDNGGGLYSSIVSAKWWLTALAGLGLAVTLWAWYGLRPLGLMISGLLVAGLGAAFSHEPVWAFSAAALALSVLLVRSGDSNANAWFASSWDFAKQVLPYLLGGVLLAGALLGRPGHEGLIPSGWIASMVGGNGLFANFFASLAGALMYFATLTEIPILQGLLGAGMGKGPALALLLAGPALSLPAVLVLIRIMGLKKTLTFVGLVVLFSTLAGWIFGAFQ